MCREETPYHHTLEGPSDLDKDGDLIYQVEQDIEEEEADSEEEIQNLFNHGDHALEQTE